MAEKSGSGIHDGWVEARTLKLGSNRKFGLTVGLIIAGLGTAQFFLKSKDSSLALVLGCVGFGLIVAGSLFPNSLAGLNKKWMQLGMLLGRITNPLILGILFFLMITPLGLLMRLFRARPLSLQFEPAARTYWKERSAKFKAQSMKRQF